MDSAQFAQQVGNAATTDRIISTSGPFYDGYGADRTSTSLIFRRDGNGIRITTGNGARVGEREARVTRVRALSDLRAGEQPSWETVGQSVTADIAFAARILDHFPVGVQHT